MPLPSPKRCGKRPENAVPFEALLKQIDGYKGRIVIVGGYILETANETDGSWITVLQAPLDSQNRPKSSDLSEGRFMVSSSKFLDPVVYSKERRITVGGKVIGSQERELGNLTYVYPVIEAMEIHLWSKEGEYIGPYYPYYDPWYRRTRVTYTLIAHYIFCSRTDDHGESVTVRISLLSISL